METIPSLLQCVGLTRYFGGLSALKDVSFSVASGEILGIVGPNGSGKTALLNCINGIYRLDAGRIYFEDDQITGKPPHEIASKGVGRTFKIPRLYSSLTVLEHLKLCRRRGGLFSSASVQPHRTNEILEFLHLDHVAAESIGRLSVEQQRLLELGMALMLDAKLILIDEIASGASSDMIDLFQACISQLNQRYQTAFIVVEHNLRFVRNLCHRVVVLSYGRKITEGTPEQVLKDTLLESAFLGISVPQ